MVHYRRCKINGGTYFFTVTLKNRASTLLVDNINELKTSIRETKASFPFTINAIVILPDHIHAIWQLPENDNAYATRWRFIKSNFTKRIIRGGVDIGKDRHGLYDLWQRRFWEHIIKDDDDYTHHVNYIHFNPVKHGYVNQVNDWPYSSFHQYVKQGMLSEDWGGIEDDYIKHLNILPNPNILFGE